MKKLFSILILILILLCGCQHNIEEKSLDSKELGRKRSISGFIIGTDSNKEENLDNTYVDILQLYKTLVKSWNADDCIEEYPNFEEDYESGKFLSQWEEFSYEWNSMVIEGKYPKKAQYAYMYWDINMDGIDEMIWLRFDEENTEPFVLAMFTIHDEKKELLGAFWSRKKCVILDTGEVYISDNGAADVNEYTLRKLEKNNMVLTEYKSYGYNQASYYLKENNEVVKILEDEFQHLLEKYPFKHGAVMKEHSIYLID